MATVRGAEVVIDAMIAKLQAGLATRIATINAEKADAITVAAPATTDYLTAPLDTISRVPAIVVLDGSTDFNANPEGPHTLGSRLTIGVFVVDGDHDRQRLGRRLERLARAVVETLWDDDPKELLTLTGCYRLQPISTSPGRVFEPDTDDSWRGWYRVAFRVDLLEE